jgi:cation transport ATPase
MQTSMQTVSMEIRGLGSEPAVRGVRSALECIRGVAQVRMVPNERVITITYDAFRVSPQQFNTAVRVMGCEVARLPIPTSDARGGAQNAGRRSLRGGDHSIK